MSSPAGSTGSGGGPTANVYTPMNQAGADQNFWQALNPMFNTGVSGANAVGATGSPYANSYLEGMPLVSNYLTNNPAANTGPNAAQNAYNFDVGTLFPQAAAGSGELFGAAAGGFPALGSIMGNAFNPEYGNVVNQAVNNPYYPMAIGGAMKGAQLGDAGATALEGSGQQILQSGFDPQSALFDRSQQQLMDQTNAVNAMSGVGGSPYGASVGANAMGNFDINWQNQQLGRQTQAAGAASPLFTEAPALAASSAGLPSMVQGSYLDSIVKALNAQNTAGIGGAGGFGSLLGSLGTGLSGANQLGQTGAAALGTFGQAPFQAGATVANADLSGLGSLAGLGQTAFGLPQQAIGDLMQYMGLGQSASGLSGQLGNMGFNQTAQGIGGALSGANSLFGNNGLFGGGGGGGAGGGLFGAGSLLGSQGPIFGTAADASIAAGGAPLALDAAAPAAAASI